MGTHRVHELAEVEIQVLLLRRAQVLSLARLAQQPVRGEEEELLQRAIDRVALPATGAAKRLSTPPEAAGSGRANPHNRRHASFQVSIEVCTCRIPL